MQFQKLSGSIKYIANYHVGSIRNILLGVDFCYAVQNKLYTHLLVNFLVTLIYAEYNLYENKKSVVKFVKTFKTKVKKYFLTPL